MPMRSAQINDQTWFLISSDQVPARIVPKTKKIFINITSNSTPPTGTNGWTATPDQPWMDGEGMAFGEHMWVKTEIGLDTISVLFPPGKTFGDAL